MKPKKSAHRATPLESKPSLPAVKPSQDKPQAAYSGSEILITTLADLGVDTLFGYPGGAVLPVYDALFTDVSMKHVLIRHEQAGSHAADGYARSTGQRALVV